MTIAPQLSQALTQAATAAASAAGISQPASPLDNSFQPAPGAIVIAATVAEPVGGRMHMILQGVQADVADVFSVAAAALTEALGVSIEDPTQVAELSSQSAIVTGAQAGDVSVVVTYSTPVSTPSKAPAGETIRRLNDVEMTVTAELGRARLTVRDILGMVPGKVVELDKIAGSPIDLLVNGKLVARGEVVVIDEEFGVRVTEIVGDEI
jgi:flagellar motor switch protein FliN/FliY